MMTAPRPLADRRKDAQNFDFRQMHPRLHFGTASDRYAGWIGKIYSEDRWAEDIKIRKKKVGTETVEERVLPIASVAEYFAHFGVLELDFTFYRPLLEEDGQASNNLHVLTQYAEAAPPEARFLLKAPQAFSAQNVHRAGGFEPNPYYLNAEQFTGRFLLPALDILEDRCAGIIFQQEYQRVRESASIQTVLQHLDHFFAEVPHEVQIHLELRSAHHLVPAYFDWLTQNGLGFIFSHWTWLPTLKAQWERCGKTFSAANNTAILRLLTAREMKYNQAFNLAYPFEGPVPALSETPEARTMLNEATALAYQAVAQDTTLFLIANNRAWGSSPHLAQALAQRFLDFAKAKGA